jgi:hypothetical protein
MTSKTFLAPNQKQKIMFTSRFEGILVTAAVTRPISGPTQAPSSKGTGVILSELSCTTLVYLVQKSLRRAIPPLLRHACRSNLAQESIYNIHITRIWSASLGSFETLALRKTRYQLIGPGALVSIHSRWLVMGSFRLQILASLTAIYVTGFLL